MLLIHTPISVGNRAATLIIIKLTLIIRLANTQNTSSLTLKGHFNFQPEIKKKKKKLKLIRDKQVFLLSVEIFTEGEKMSFGNWNIKENVCKLL